MNLREVALGKEGDGSGYYLRCGAEAGIPGLRRIFEMLSDDEVRHAAALHALHALQGGARVELAHSPTLDGAKSILRRLAVRESALSTFNGLCGQLAREAAHGWEKELFLTIAAEDEMHFTLLEYMCDLLKPAGSVGGGDAGGTDAN